MGLDPERDRPDVGAFLSRVHPDDAATMRTGIEQLLTGKRTHGAGRYRLLQPGGGQREVIARWQVVHREDGTPHYLYGTLQDVTDALQENDRLSRVLDELARAQRLANVGSWHWDFVNDQLEWSAQLYRILGYDLSVAPSPEAWLARVHPEDAGHFQSDCGTQLSTAAELPAELRLVRPDGEVRWVSLEVETTCDDAGKPIRARGVVLDITERRRLETRLLEATRLEATGRLASGVAHDFNNLLTVVQSNVDRLRRSLDPQCLDHIETAVRTASGLTQRLLTFGRQAVQRPRVLDLNRTVSEVLGLLHGLLPPTVTVEFQQGAGLPPVRLDESQMHQVLLNLITNARDAMPDGGQLGIATECVTLGPQPSSPETPLLPPGVYVVLSVQDSGCGMDNEVRSRVFEPFFTTKPLGQGTGLGLATVFGIVTQSGGTVEVTTEPNSGSCFRLYFPAVAERIEEVSRSPSAPPSTVRILLVEDNDLIREPITFLLRDAGYDVEVAASAAEARRVWRNEKGRFDVLMTDIVMPGDSGTALARDLRGERPDLRVLFMTGYVDTTTPKPDRWTEILQKPFRLSRPLEALQRLTAAS
jgi:PAS domain S-box-containing protein